MSDDERNNDESTVFNAGLRCLDGCIYAVKGDVDPKTLKSKTICRRFPPSASAFIVHGPGGQPTLAMATMYPEISPDMFACAEFDDGTGDYSLLDERPPPVGH